MAPPFDGEITVDRDEAERIKERLRAAGYEESVDDSVLGAQVSELDPHISSLDLSSRENYVQRQQQDLTRLLGAQRDAEEQALTPSSLGRGDLLATTFTSVLPTLLGAAIAGRKGLYAGAQAGLGGAAIGVKGLEAEGQKDRERAALRAKGFSDDIKATRDSIKQQVEGGFDAREKEASDNRLAARNEANASEQTARLLAGINLKSETSERLADKKIAANASLAQLNSELKSARDQKLLEQRGAQDLVRQARRAQDEIVRLETQYSLIAKNASESDKRDYLNRSQLLKDKLATTMEELEVKNQYAKEAADREAEIKLLLQDDQQSFLGEEGLFNRAARERMNNADNQTSVDIFGRKVVAEKDRDNRKLEADQLLQKGAAENAQDLENLKSGNFGANQDKRLSMAERLAQLKEGGLGERQRVAEAGQGDRLDRKIAQENLGREDTQQFTAQENDKRRAAAKEMAAAQRAALGNRVIAQQGGFATEGDLTARKEMLRSLGVSEDQMAALRPGLTLQGADRIVSSQRLAKQILSKDLPTDVRNALTSATTSSYKIDNMLVGLRAYTAKNGKSAAGNLTSAALDSVLPLSERRKLAAELGFFATNVGSEMQGKNLNGPELKSIQDFLTSNESLASITRRNGVDMNLLVSRIEQLRNQPKVAALARLKALGANPARREQVEEIYRESKGALTPIPIGATPLYKKGSSVVAGYRIGDQVYGLPDSIYSPELTALLEGEQ